MAKKKNTGGHAGAAMVGASVAVLGAAAYLLFGPEGKKHQKNLRSWMIKMKGEIMEKMESAKDLSAEAYGKIVSDVEAKYKAMKNVDAADVEKEIAELKKNWRAMMKAAKTKAAPAKKTVKKAAKRSAK